MENHIKDFESAIGELETIVKTLAAGGRGVAVHQFLENHRAERLHAVIHASAFAGAFPLVLDGFEDAIEEAVEAVE